MLHYIKVRKLYLLIWPIHHTQIRPIRDQNKCKHYIHWIYLQCRHNKIHSWIIKKFSCSNIHSLIIMTFSCSNIHEYNKIEAMQYKKVVNIPCLLMSKFIAVDLEKHCRSTNDRWSITKYLNFILLICMYIVHTHYS